MRHLGLSIRVQTLSTLGIVARMESWRYLAREIWRMCGGMSHASQHRVRIDNRTSSLAEIQAGWRAHNITGDTDSGVGAGAPPSLAQYLLWSRSWHGTAAGRWANGRQEPQISDAGRTRRLVAYLRTVPAIAGHCRCPRGAGARLAPRGVIAIFDPRGSNCLRPAPASEILRTPGRGVRAHAFARRTRARGSYVRPHVAQMARPRRVRRRQVPCHVDQNPQ